MQSYQYFEHDFCIKSFTTFKMNSKNQTSWHKTFKLCYDKNLHFSLTEFLWDRFQTLEDVEFLVALFQQILNLNLLLDLWLCSAGLRYLDSKWQIIFGWTVAKQTLHRHSLHHHRHFQPHHSTLLLRMLRCSERSEMSFVNLRCVHDVAAGHLGGRRGPLLHLQGPGGQHNTGGDDRGHSKLWPRKSWR